MVYLAFIPFLFGVFPEQEPVEMEIIGVYQGTSLFIQNPYLVEKQAFCVKSVLVNDERQDLNYNLSALKLDFEDNDLYTPVTIRIRSTDSLCAPIIINPNAILFHTAYKFTYVNLSDSALVWETEGERETGRYTVEKFDGGLWLDVDVQQATQRFEAASYTYFPQLDEGGNKYRIKYEFGNGRYLYSDEVVYDHYPEPVVINPKKTSKVIRFSRSASYEIFDQNSKMVLSGVGVEVDVTRLWPGDYVIYFDGKDPQTFTRERY